MRNLILVAALSTALAACNNAAEESDEPEPAATTEAAPEATATSSAGTYDVTTSDGTKFTATLNTDGTYQDTDADGTVTAKGTWEDKGEQTCFDAEGEGPVVCYTVGEAAADGSMAATPDDGTAPLTIKKTS